MGDIVVVLGNRNDPDGSLSVAARERCARAIELLSALPPDAKVIATGGFGDFNKSDIAHSVLIENELLSLGLDRSRILPRVISNGTHQDAIGVLRQLFDFNFRGEVHIVTSAFHMKRVRRVFGHFLASFNLSFYEADHASSESEFEHEVHAVAEFDRIKSNVAIAVDSESQDLDRLVSELRHYDILSYYSLTASFLMIAYTYSRLSALTPGNPADFYSLVQFAFSVFISVGFLIIYERFADTAWIFRTAAKDLAFFLRKADISSGPKTKLSGLNTRTWMHLVFGLGWAANLSQFLASL